MLKVDSELFRIRNFIPMVLCICLSVLVPAAAVSGSETQDSSTGTPAREPGQKQDYTIRVEVEEVRVDAVVLNFRGIQVTDLTADDFSIYQDGKRQEITSCRYIKESMPGGGREFEVFHPQD